MKTLTKILALPLLILTCAVIFSACKDTPRPDTSAVAGKYFRHDGGTISEKFILLNADSTWATDATDENEIAGTFKIEGETEISFYVGSMRMMYGTIENGVMNLHVYAIFEWHAATFSKTEA